MPKATFAKDRQGRYQNEEKMATCIAIEVQETGTTAKEDKMIPEQSGISHVA
jgi:hypothetical protein